MMPLATFLLAGLLFGLGLIGYFGSGRESVTALIPAFFAIPFVICAAFAQANYGRKHAMHAAATLALLGFLGTAKSWWDVFLALQNGVDILSRTAAKATMAGLCAIYLVLAIRSFTHARRARQGI